jgi:hypothetical protein
MQPTAAQDCRRQYAPSIWGDFFISYKPCTQEELLSMQEKAHTMKEEVRQILLAVAAASSCDDDLVQKLELVDTLQRLGVDYHFKKEIDDMLLAVYGDKDGGSDNLYTAALRFYLLRKHGYGVTSGKKLFHYFIIYADTNYELH